jgi:EcsC protein family
MHGIDILPRQAGNACAGLSAADRRQLADAAQTMLDARTIVMKIADSVGHAVAQTGGIASDFVRRTFRIDLRAKSVEIVEQLLWTMQAGAMVGLESRPAGEDWGWFHKAIGVASGASSGFFGTPGLLWDLPITTTMIMRSVAEIARTYPGESLATADTRRACIEVFSFGSPESGDEDADAGYWAARMGLDHATIGLVIRQVATRFGIVLSEKTLAQAVPIAGMLAGAGLNYAYIGYYQQMARVHFAIRDVERRAADPAAIRPCFTQTLRQIRENRRPRRPA